MARPEGEDVRKVNKENYPVKPKEEALELPKKKQLNLKPDTVKKINRKTTEKKEEPPKKEAPKKTVEKEDLPKKKEKLIRIEKVK